MSKKQNTFALLENKIPGPGDYDVVESTNFLKSKVWGTNIQAFGQTEKRFAGPV